MFLNASQNVALFFLWAQTEPQEVKPLCCLWTFRTVCLAGGVGRSAVSCSEAEVDRWSYLELRKRRHHKLPVALELSAGVPHQEQLRQVDVVFQGLHAAQAAHKVHRQVQLLEALAAWRQEVNTQIDKVSVTLTLYNTLITSVLYQTLRLQTRHVPGCFIGLQNSWTDLCLVSLWQFLWALNNSRGSNKWLMKKWITTICVEFHNKCTPNFN